MFHLTEKLSSPQYKILQPLITFKTEKNKKNKNALYKKN